MKAYRIWEIICILCILTLAARGLYIWQPSIWQFILFVLMPLTFFASIATIPEEKEQDIVDRILNKKEDDKQ